MKGLKRIATIGYNGFLVGFMALVAMALLPKIEGQFAARDRIPLGPLRDWTEAMGFIGLGLLCGITLGAMAVSSPFWGRVSPVWRILMGVAYLVLVAGAVVVGKVEREWVGSTDTAGYLMFLGLVGFFVVPLVGVGKGLPSVAWGKIAPLLNKGR